MKETIKQYEEREKRGAHQRPEFYLIPMMIATLGALAVIGLWFLISGEWKMPEAEVKVETKTEITNEQIFKVLKDIEKQLSKEKF